MTDRLRIGRRRDPARDVAVPAMSYAGFWRRALAAQLDFVLSLCIGGGLASLAQSLLALAPLGVGAQAQLPLVGVAVLFVFQVLYFTWFEASSWRATPAKRILGLRVTDREGKPLSFSRALARTLLKIIALLPLGLGLMLAGVTKRKQAMPDLVTGALVMRKNGQLPLSGRWARLEVPVVACISIGFMVLAVNAANMAAGERLGSMRGKFVVISSLRTLQPAMEIISRGFAEKGAPPDKLPATAIDTNVLPPETIIIYNAASGSLALFYQQGMLTRQGFTLLPTPASNGSVAWTCIATQLEPQNRAGLCNETTVAVVPGAR